MAKKKFYYHLDSRLIASSKIEIIGWVSFSDEPVDSIELLDHNKNKLDSTLLIEDRPDVASLFSAKPQNSYYGFDIVSKIYPKYLRVRKKNRTKLIRVTGRKVDLIEGIDNMRRNKGDFTTADMKRTLSILDPLDYQNFCSIQHIKDKEKRIQSKDKGVSNIIFSILVPLYNTPLKFLSAMIDSVLSQTYQNWELCLVDGSDEDHIEGVREEVKKYSDNDKRIKYRKLENNEGISENTNKALKMAYGDFIVLFDHDDLLTPDALYEFASAIEKEPECDCIYSDEDKTDETGKVFFDAHFKPDYSIDLLCSVNYICHLFAVRKTLIDQYGGFRSEYDGSQDHDFILRMTEQARKTVHVPKVLYHWRVHSNSTALDPHAKMYCFDAGKRAIMAHYERVWPQIRIDHMEDGISLGIYHTIWAFDEYPLVSVIIPSKDHIEDLDKTVRSMITKGTWQNIEFVIVENNSEKAETFAYYEKIQKEFANVRVVKYDGDFNYSKINNFGEKYTRGEYLLLMNNDVELIDPDSVKEMVGYCQREDVGIVGCRLLYRDGTIQHAGVILGIGGIADHAFKNQEPDKTYFSRAMIAQDYSAVTAAVMMVRKSTYEEVGGFDEQFAVAFNDVDFCLRVRKKNRLIVYNPYACFYHYESKSRGKETTISKQKRFASEISLFIQRYENLLKSGDPFYNQNLTLLKTDYSLKNIKYMKVTDPYFTQKEFDTYKKIK